MTVSSSFRPLLVQHGTATVVDGLVNEIFEVDIGAQTGTQSFHRNTLETYFQIYNFELNFDSERGLPIGNPVSYTSAADSEYFNWSFETTLSSIPTTLTLVYYSNLSQSAAWTVGQYTGSGTTVLETYADGSASEVLTMNGPSYDFSYDIDLNTAYTQNAATANGNRNITMMSNMSNSKWNGYFALGFYATTAHFVQFEPDTFDRGSIAGQQVPFHTGWEGFPASRGRPVPDMRSGMPSFAQDLQEDGQQEGIWTSAANWDYKDPREIRPVEFPPNESLRDDDVPV